MLRIITENGRFEIENPELERRVLEQRVALQETAEAEQRALSAVYRVGGEPDPTRPYNGLLTERLAISEKTARNLVLDGRIGYTLIGEKKGYRVSERQVREFLGDLPATT